MIAIFHELKERAIDPGPLNSLYCCTGTLPMDHCVWIFLKLDRESRTMNLYSFGTIEFCLQAEGLNSLQIWLIASGISIALSTEALAVNDGD